MKLAACYSVFNSAELLHGSIQQIYNYVDVVIICYQKTSNVGNFITEKDLQIIQDMELIGSIYLLEFDPNLSLNPKVNERAKLQMRIDFAKELGCTHYFGVACDHYYKPGEFAFAKQRCIEMDVDVTLTEMFTYYKEPTYQLYPIEDYCCPFICKIYPDTQVVSQNNYKERVDPSVRISPSNSFYTFKQAEIMLHHFSMVRYDMESKFNNAAAAQNWPDKIPHFLEEYNTARPGSEISYFKGRKIREVPNFFGIDLT